MGSTQLIFISIGTPETGLKLVDHLNIPNLIDYLYVDPTTTLYNSLQLNKGIKETFFSPSTSFAFLKRFTKPDGMKELNEILPKWNKGKFKKERRRYLYCAVFFIFSRVTLKEKVNYYILFVGRCN